VAEIAARSVLALIKESHRSQQVLFWRTQASQLRDCVSATRAQVAQAARERRQWMTAERRLAMHAQRGNFRSLATGLARLGPFEGWIVATHDSDGLRMRDARRVPPEVIRHPDLLHPLGRYARAKRCGVLNAAKSSRGGMCRVIRDAGYKACLYVPMESGVILLLARDHIGASVRARIAACRSTLIPHLKLFVLGRELERQHALVRSLIRGLFALTDAERARFRRDLHDDFAQLLSAAQIALNGNRQSARRFFRDLEMKLKDRLDTLRPQRMLQAGFRQALDGELQRLREAGIRANASINGLKGIPVAAREVLMRVITEGVSNVIRHAGADRVDIEIQRRNGLAIVSVRDNGRGDGNSKKNAGLGLQGLGDRVAILGGKSQFDLRPGGSELSAEIPVAQL
jgi:signal transduction histidine kinase